MTEKTQLKGGAWTPPPKRSVIKTHNNKDFVKISAQKPNKKEVERAEAMRRRKNKTRNQRRQAPRQQEFKD